MPTKTTLKAVAWTLVALAAINRVPAAKEAIQGDSKLFGLF